MRLPPGDYAFFNSNHIPDGTIQEIRFAVDSPLEEAVSSEPVSEAKLNFIESELRGASTAAKTGVKPDPYGPIPYVSEQGIFAALQGI